MILTLLRQTTAFQKCHIRLTEAAAQSPLLSQAFEKFTKANTSVPFSPRQFSQTDIRKILESFMEDILGAPFLGKDLFCLKSLSRYSCDQCGDEAITTKNKS